MRKQPPEPEMQFRIFTEEDLNGFKKKRQVAFGAMELLRDVVRKLEKLGKTGYDKEGHGGEFSEVHEMAHQEYNRDSQRYRRACDLVTQMQTAWEARKPPPTPVKKKPASYSELLRPSKLQRSRKTRLRRQKKPVGRPVESSNLIDWRGTSRNY